MDGAIVVDKPKNWTSHDVVGKMRRIAGTRRVGHLGTLDPMATGVLPVLLNRATRLSQFLMKADKEYDAVIRFGFATTTFDAEGEPVGSPVAVLLDRSALEQELEVFRGDIEQVPPPVSAKKVGGVPAYKLVRREVEFELLPVRVTVYALELISCDVDRARVRVHCSSGTYVRRIAHDLGVAMGCGAHLESLRRTRAGCFGIGMAKPLEVLQTMASEGRLADALISSAQLLPDFPEERVDAPTAGMIRQGRDFRVSPFRVRSGSRYVKAVTEDGDLIAIGQMVLPNLYHPMLVL
jgi:tRNA pseudouridine55 synthase